MLEIRTVLPHTLELLRQLSQEPILAGTRLVGGTALALQYGHRSSVDLDFFGTISDDSQGIQQALAHAGELRIASETKNIKCYFLDDIKIDIVNYAYPWIDEPVKEESLTLASPRDIAAMKINAIEGRGSKKDFIDIYFLLKHFSLKEILDFYEQKYPEHSVFRALMSLTYFADADMQAMPKMYEGVKWADIKKHIEKEVTTFNAKR